MSNRSRSLLQLALLAALTLPASSALAWPTVEPEGHRIPVLAGRWTIALPENTVRAAVQMPPNAPIAREERDSASLLQTDEGNFGLRAALLESTRPDDLAAAVRALPAPCASPTYGPVGERTDLFAIRCTEPSPDGAFRPISVFAVHTDGWVDRIEALVETRDPDDEAGRAGGVVYAEAVMATLQAVDLPAPVERGTVDVAVACEQGGEADHLTLTLPEGWIVMRDPLPGGELLRVTQVVPLGAERAIAAIEVAPAGTEPPRVPEGAGQHEHHTLLGQDADWVVLHSEGAASSVQQLATEMTVDCGGGSTFARAIRVSIGGPVGSITDARTVVESMALASTRGHAITWETVSSESPAVDPAALTPAQVEDREMEERGHFWSIAIGGASLLLLAAALVMRSRTTRPK